MAITKFALNDGFIRELTKDKHLIHRQIVRVEQESDASGSHPLNRSVYVVATTEVLGDVVRLDSFVGELTGDEERDRLIVNRFRAESASLARRLADLGFEVRGGILTEAVDGE